MAILRIYVLIPQPIHRHSIKTYCLLASCGLFLGNMGGCKDCWEKMREAPGPDMSKVIQPSTFANRLDAGLRKASVLGIRVHVRTVTLRRL